MSVFEMIIRTTISFVLLYIFCRVLNEKLIAKMTFCYFVDGLTIGSIVASYMLVKDVPIMIGTV